MADAAQIRNGAAEIWQEQPGIVAGVSKTRPAILCRNW